MVWNSLLQWLVLKWKTPAIRVAYKRSLQLDPNSELDTEVELLGKLLSMMPSNAEYMTQPGLATVDQTQA